jgi:hypothetical protein
LVKELKANWGNGKMDFGLIFSNHHQHPHEGKNLLGNWENNWKNEKMDLEQMESRRRMKVDANGKIGILGILRDGVKGKVNE